MFGVAGAAALASTVRPLDAMAGVPGAKSGILANLMRQTQRPSTKVLRQKWSRSTIDAGTAAIAAAGLEKGLPSLLAVWSPAHPLLSPSCLDLVSVLATSPSVEQVGSSRQARQSHLLEAAGRRLIAEREVA
ncbi:hypothetical protein AJ88_26275 [Mesorhizobium amorphae CCBAU 01583]|nr:hypothetical protein AJ88_26275 [Mesorhizobium amorphae CCBAU 01583]